MVGDVAVFAQSKSGNTDNLNLEAAMGSPDGIDSRGFIKVNRDMQTMAPHIYAVGNVISQTGVSYLSGYQSTRDGHDGREWGPEPF